MTIFLFPPLCLSLSLTFLLLPFTLEFEIGEYCVMGKGGGGRELCVFPIDHTRVITEAEDMGSQATLDLPAALRLTLSYGKNESRRCKLLKMSMLLF